MRTANLLLCIFLILAPCVTAFSINTKFLTGWMRQSPPATATATATATLIRNSRRTQRQYKSRLLSMKASSPPPYPVRIAVMGGGNFGLALASVCARKGIPTTLLVRSKEIADEINTTHKHPRYMKDIVLPARVRATADPSECLPDATYIVHAVPVQYSRTFLESVAQYIPPNTPVLSGSKGIETTSLGFMLNILKETLGDDRPYAFLSGPSFAREICEGVATAVVVASEDLLLAQDLAELLSDENFCVFTSKDVVGVEIGGAVKNVIALAAGMCEGLGLGTNAMSALVTRGCGEMRRLGLTFGARSSTISGLSGELCCVWVVSYFSYVVLCFQSDRTCFLLYR
jgi:glycerol-3-phosphate dehydrogenase (NAD+)